MAATRAKKRRSRFAFSPRGADNKPQLVIMLRMSKKRLRLMRGAARVKVLIRGTVEADDRGKLVFETEHAQAALLTRALRAALPPLAPALRGAWVINPDGDEIDEPSPGAPDLVPATALTREEAEDLRRVEALEAANRESGKSIEYEDKASFVLSPGGTITVVAMERPSFRRSTTRELAERYPELHDEDGRLLPGNDRRHALAWEMLELQMAHELLGCSLVEAADWLADEGYPPRSDRIEDISDATWRLAKDRFNDLDNLWVGESRSNQNLGRLIPVLKRLMIEVKGGLDLEAHPVTRSLRSFDIPKMTRLVVDDPEILRSWFFQALLDPELVDREDTAELLTRAEGIFQRMFPKADYYNEAN